MLGLLFPKMQRGMNCAVDTPNWAIIDQLARRHRLVPLLHHRLQQSDIRPPDDMMSAWAERRRRSLLASLRAQADLCWVHDCLAELNIDYRALKGAFLAWQVYSHPELRPLRDLDVLVPDYDVKRAFDHLLAKGATRLPHAPGDPSAAVLLDRKHLPPILLPNKTILELHRRLFKPTQPIELSLQPGFWNRASTAEIAGRVITFPDIEDQLLHLVVHAVDDHLFSNGPLALSDIALMRQQPGIDWPAVHIRSLELGCARSLGLATAMVEALEGVSSTGAVDVPSPVLGSALDLTLGARSDYRSIPNAARHKTGFFRHLRLVVASEFAIDVGSWRTVLLIPLATFRVLRKRMKRSIDEDQMEVTRVSLWLQNTAN
ncbi:nucleotidyltransferase family protein [Sphingomonas hylomeconis]|uniref:Nucleotidyltransferase family protein n=1 Tax=Sphingomonas hylomeconis TaxID=1395958 RepID=A0ABV7STA1_9SPHN